MVLGAHGVEKAPAVHVALWSFREYHGASVSVYVFTLPITTPFSFYIVLSCVAFQSGHVYDVDTTPSMSSRNFAMTCNATISRQHNVSLRNFAATHTLLTCRG